METIAHQIQLIPTTIKDPRIFTVVGFVLGLTIWFVDAVIDVYIIHPDEELIESLFFAEGTELWMRSLVVIVTAIGGWFASRAFRKAQDLNILLFKYQFELEELVRTRTKSLEEKSDQLEKLASIDPLTEIYNRRKFIEVCEIELNRFARHHHAFSIFMLDIDDFKNINDNYGHDIGDIVIKKVADTIRHATRGSDYFGRWGGEEFIIMSPDSDNEGRCILADKLVKIIAETEFKKIGRITMSVGVTISNEADTNLDDIIKRADQGLYRAKELGKNQYQVVD